MSLRGSNPSSVCVSPAVCASRSRFRSLLVAPILGLLLGSSGTARAELTSVKFMRIDPVPTTDSKTGAPAMHFIVEMGAATPINTFTEGCIATTDKKDTLSRDRATDEAMRCMSNKIQKEGYFKPIAEFPKEKAVILTPVDGEQRPLEIMSVSTLKDAAEGQTGVAWLILIDGSSSVDKRWPEIQETAEAIVKAMGEHDAVMIRIMDDKTTRDRTKWISAANKSQAISLIRRVTTPYKSGSTADNLAGRLQKEIVGSFQELINTGVSGGEEDVYPLIQSVVVLSDGGSTSISGLSAPVEAKAIHERLVKGDIAVTMGDINLRMPVPVTTIWFPKGEWSGADKEFRRDAEFDFMYNFATPEVGGYFDVILAGDTGKGAKIGKKLRDRFDAMFWITAKASCLSLQTEQTFLLSFPEDKKIGAFSWKNVPIALSPDTIVKWLLDVDKKKTEETANKNPLLPGDTFQVFGNFCWGTNSGAAEAYFLTESDAAAVKKAAADKTGKKARELLQDLAAKGQKAETVQVSEVMAKFRAPTTASLFDKQTETFSLNLIVLDTKSKRVSALDQKKLIILKAAKPPVSRFIIVAAIAGGVVLILLIAILARSGGGGGRRGKRRGGAAPGPAPMPGQPPGAQPAALRIGVAPAMPLAGAGVMPMDRMPAATAMPMDRSPAATAMPMGAPPPQGPAFPAARKDATIVAPPSPFGAPTPQYAAAAPVPYGVPQAPYPDPPALPYAPASGAVPHAAVPHAAAYVPSNIGATTAQVIAPAIGYSPPLGNPGHVSPIDATAFAPPAGGSFSAGASGPTVHPGHPGGSLPTACPSCGKPVHVPPGASAQCVFCGTLVDSRGVAFSGPQGSNFGLTAAVDEDAARRAVAGADARAGAGPGGAFGSTVAIRSSHNVPTNSVLVEGSGGTFRILASMECRLGRDPALCSLVIDEGRLSGVHATLRLEGGGLQVRDERSHNGTYVNGNRIAEGVWTPVPFGSQLRFGPLEFGVRHES